MSKESAMAVATGAPVPVTPGVADAVTPQAASTPGSTDPRIQALLKKEVGLVKEREAFNRQKQEWEQRTKQADAVLAKAKQFEDTLQTDAVAALKLIGYSDTQIFNIMADANKEKPQKTPEEIAAETTQKFLKERDEADAKKNAELQEKSNARAVTTAIHNLLGDPANAEKLEYCAYYADAAQEIIKDTLFEFAAQAQKEAKDKGEILNIDDVIAQRLLMEAAEAVEAWYESSDKEMQAKIKKRKALTGETTAEATAAVASETVVAPVPAAAPPPPKAPENPAAQSRAKTITNRVAATSPALAGQKETKAQKRARLERVLSTGDRGLLRV